MASSKVMSSRSPPNPDLPRQSVPPSQIQPDRGGAAFGSMNMEEILKSFYSDSDSNVKGEKGLSEMMMTEMVAVENKTIPMTLEDYLAKAGAVAEEDVRLPMIAGTYGMEGVMVAGVVPPVQFGSSVKNGGFGVEFGNNGAAGGGGRGKRRAAVEDVPLDKATQQKQRRMIKNRESAARSRERKQVNLLLCYLFVCLFMHFSILLIIEFVSGCLNVLLLLLFKGLYY